MSGKQISGASCFNYLDCLLKTVILLFIFFISSCSYTKFGCKDDWKITGFYTPIESDFVNLNKSTIRLKSGKSYSLNSDFVSTVKIEGWGRTRSGWYLGFYSNQWYRSNKPLNAKGMPLVKGVVAVDNRLISRGAQLVIPGLKNTLGVEKFRADDVGSGIRNRHIDVYTGEGITAKEMTYKITGQQKVCFLPLKKAVPIIDLT